MTVTSEHLSQVIAPLHEEVVAPAGAHDFLSMQVLTPHLVPRYESVVLQSWQTPGFAAQPRNHHLQKLELPNGRHVRIHSEPDPDLPSQQLTVAGLSGWTESVHGPIIRNTHLALASALPAATIDTHATYGIDGTLPNHATRTILDQSVDTIARHTFESFQALYPDDQRLVIVATSMGAAVCARMVQHNIEAGEPLNLAGFILYEPYLKARNKAGVAAAARFLTHVSVDYIAELARVRDPRKVGNLLLDSIRSLPDAADLPVIAMQGLSLIWGTEQRQVDALGGLPHIVDIQGERDCVRNRLFEGLPGVQTKLIGGKGHAMGLDWNKRATSISHALRDQGLYQAA